LILHKNAVRFYLIMISTCFFLVHVNSYAQANRDQLHIPDISIDKIEDMIDVGGRKLHFCTYGNKSPSVILISGFNAPQIYWNAIIPDIAEKATVITYDRPGYGKSEIGELPLHGEQTAKDLFVLLEKFKVPKPYIIVGHSYGGDIARLFVSMYPEVTGGLILEDTQHEDILEEQRRLLTGQNLKKLDEMVSHMGDPVNPKSELDYRSATWDQLRKSKPLPKVPYIVITSGERAKGVPPMFSEGAREKLIVLGLDLQKRLLKLIPDGKHIIAEGAGHNIHIEKPEIVSNAIVEMINEVNNEK